MSNPKWQMMDKWEAQEWGPMDVCIVLVDNRHINTPCIVLSEGKSLLFSMPNGEHMELDPDDPRLRGFKRFGCAGWASEELYPSDKHPANKRVKKLEYAIGRALASDNIEEIRGILEQQGEK